MVVLLLSVFGGMIAFAIDLGSLMADRRDLQNAADAIALAASLDLPDESAARTAANQWAIKNGIDPASMTVTIFPQSLPTEPNPRVRVELQREHGFTFARMIGINSATVSSVAAAIKTSPAGGAGMVPIAVTEAALDAALSEDGWGATVTLKYDSNNILSGNTGPVRIDGPGGGNCNTDSNRYCDGVQHGSENTVCAAGADTTYCTGPWVVDTEPGNKIGNTRTAIDYRINNTDDECAVFDDVFEPDLTTSDPDDWRIVWDCNPFLAGGFDSERVIIIPVIDELCNGACQVTIVSFALFFLEGYGSGGCTGNDCEITGRFVRVNQNLGLLAGTFDPNSFNQFVRLVE